MEPTDEQVRQAIEALLLDRAPTATICPSEAARVLAPHAWRALMPRVRDVAFALARAGHLDIRQRGRSLSPHAVPRGPIRLARGKAPRNDPESQP